MRAFTRCFAVWSLTGFFVLILSAQQLLAVFPANLNKVLKQKLRSTEIPKDIFAQSKHYQLKLYLNKNRMCRFSTPQDNCKKKMDMSKSNIFTSTFLLSSPPNY